MIKWKHLFKDRIIDRGFLYYEDNNVTHLKRTGNKYSAIVCGSDIYEASLEINDNEIANLKCNCPYANEGHNCKHMAALIYEIESVIGDENSGKPSEELIDDEDFKEFNSKYEFINKDDLMKFVYKTINNYLEVREDFLEEFETNDDDSFRPFKVSHYKQLVDKLIESYPREAEDDFDSWNYNDPNELFLIDAEEFIEDYLIILNIMGFYGCSFEVFKYLYESLHIVWDKSMGTIFFDEIADTIDAFIEEDCQKTDDENLKREIALWNENRKQVKTYS